MTGIQQLSALATIISWLDKARWDNPDEIIKNSVYQSLNSEQKILVHWLCYITDLQRPWEMVWDKGGIIFSQLVKDYSEEQLNRHDITGFLEKHQRNRPHGQGKLTPFWAMHAKQEVYYTPRFPAQYKQIDRTLELLLDYGKSLINFMYQYINQYKNDPEGLVHIAHALDLLTYRTEVDTQEARACFKSRPKMDNHYKLWQIRRTEGHKRLWAALRDYVKNKNNRSCTEQYFLWPAKNFELNQLELPGDVWNDRFSRLLLYKIAEATGVKLRVKRNFISAPALAREIYLRVKETNPYFYAEQLDVSFDFAPRMCNKQLCSICPFGQNAALKLCDENPDKFCPILLTTCGYKLNCSPRECPIKERIGQGLCSHGHGTEVAQK